MTTDITILFVHKQSPSVSYSNDDDEDSSRAASSCWGG